jgi:hypothetical protein
VNRDSLRDFDIQRVRYMDVNPNNAGLEAPAGILNGLLGLLILVCVVLAVVAVVSLFR